MSPSSKLLWVGQFRDDWLLVFDPDLQPRIDQQTDDDVHVYLVGDGKARQFNRHIRKDLASIHGERRDAAIAEYLAWKIDNIEEYRDIQKYFYEKRLANNEKQKSAFIARHHQYLKNIGRTDLGFVEIKAESRRDTHCYECKESLRGDFHIQCLSCKWMICECGACGCGYSDHK